jgi:hypothetical protein
LPDAFVSLLADPFELMQESLMAISSDSPISQVFVEETFAASAGGDPRSAPLPAMPEFGPGRAIAQNRTVARAPTARREWKAGIRLFRVGTHLPPADGAEAERKSRFRARLHDDLVRRADGEIPTQTKAGSPFRSGGLHPAPVHSIADAERTGGPERFAGESGTGVFAPSWNRQSAGQSEVMKRERPRTVAALDRPSPPASGEIVPSRRQDNETVRPEQRDQEVGTRLARSATRLSAVLNSNLKSREAPMQSAASPKREPRFGEDAEGGEVKAGDANRAFVIPESEAQAEADIFEAPSSPAIEAVMEDLYERLRLEFLRIYGTSGG